VSTAPISPSGPFRILRQLRQGKDPSTTAPQFRSPHLRRHRRAL